VLNELHHNYNNIHHGLLLNLLFLPLIFLITHKILITAKFPMQIDWVNLLHMHFLHLLLLPHHPLLFEL
jgi:hypothetical protein